MWIRSHSWLNTNKEFNLNEVNKQKNKQTKLWKTVQLNEDGALAPPITDTEGQDGVTVRRPVPFSADGNLWFSQVKDLHVPCLKIHFPI